MIGIVHPASMKNSTQGMLDILKRQVVCSNSRGVSELEIGTSSTPQEAWLGIVGHT
jgi:hypothetical protein